MTDARLTQLMKDLGLIQDWNRRGSRQPRSQVQLVRAQHRALLVAALAQERVGTWEKAHSYVDKLDRSQVSDSEIVEMALSHFLEQAQCAKDELATMADGLEQR